MLELPKGRKSDLADATWPTGCAKSFGPGNTPSIATSRLCAASAIRCRFSTERYGELGRSDTFSGRKVHGQENTPAVQFGDDVLYRRQVGRGQRLRRKRDRAIGGRVKR